MEYHNVKLIKQGFGRRKRGGGEGRESAWLPGMKLFSKCTRARRKKCVDMALYHLTQRMQV